VSSAAAEAALVSELGLRPGKSWDPRQVNESIRLLQRSGNYRSLRIETLSFSQGIDVVIRANPLRVVRSVEMPGMDSEIEESIRSEFDLAGGKSVDVLTFEAIKTRLIELYQQKGYANASVEIQFEDVEHSTQADVKIVVRAGSPIRVKSIQLTGVSGDENASLMRLVSWRRGDLFSKEKLSQTVTKINRYLRDNQLTHSVVEDPVLTFSEDKLSVAIRLPIKLGERFNHQFVGNTVIPDDELRGLLTQDILSQMDGYARVADQIKVRYQTLGYHFSEVSVNQSKEAITGRNMVTFQITENNRVRIDGIDFDIRGDIESAELKNLFYQVAPGVLARGIYWEAGLGPASAQLDARLKDMGYLNAVMGSPRSAFTDDGQGVQLFYLAEIGVRNSLTEVNVIGDLKTNRDDILRHSELRLGEPLGTGGLEISVQKLKKWYASEGYVDATVEVVNPIEFSYDQRQVSVKFRIKEGRQYRVGKISVQGNEKTQDHVILREFQLRSGDIFNVSKVRQSEEDIQALGLFSRAEILASSQLADPSLKDISIVVRETSPGVGEFGAGVVYLEPRLRLRGFGGVAYRNLRGLNHTLSGRGEIRLPFSQNQVIPFVEYLASVGYRAPYPFEIPLNFLANIGLDRFEVANLGDSTNILTQAKIEGRVEKKLGSKVTGIYRLYRYEFSKTEVLNDPSADIKDTIGSTGPGLIVDLRNDIFNPTRGSYHTLDLELAHPSLLSKAGTAFLMSTSRNSFYFPMMKPFSFTFFAGFGHAVSLYDDFTLPTVRRINDLALGGQGSIRGFSLRRFAPAANVHETAFYNFRGELAVEMFDPVSAVVFLDSGRIFPNLISSDASPRHDSVGLGIRYRTPVGPVVVDVAQGLGDDKEAVRFYFSIGKL